MSIGQAIAQVADGGVASITELGKKSSPGTLQEGGIAMRWMTAIQRAMAVAVVAATEAFLPKN